MAVQFKKLPFWLSLWLVFTAVMFCYDFLFLYWRPLSFDHPVWNLWYKKYVNVDTQYKNEKDGFLWFQAGMNLVEAGLGLFAVFQDQLCCRFMKMGGIESCPKCHSYAILTAFSANLMTFWKTVLYFGVEMANGYPSTGHNDPMTWWVFYFLPSFLWLVVPVIAMGVLAGRMFRKMNYPYTPQKKED